MCSCELSIKPIMPLARQNGAALIIGLVLLMSLTIIGIGALSTTSLEQRMAGNMADLNLAFNAAETAGREFGTLIFPLVGKEQIPSNNCDTRPPNTPCITEGLAPNWWDNADDAFWAANGMTYNTAIQGVKSQPRYIAEIQYVQKPINIGIERPKGLTYFYRITSRGTGASDNTESVIQQIYRKDFE